MLTVSSRARTAHLPLLPDRPCRKTPWRGRIIALVLLSAPALASLAADGPAPPATRDARSWPFAAASIWNMPIGSGAVYTPAGIPPTPGNSPWAPMPQVDNEIIILTPGAPATAIMESRVGWQSGDRCSIAPAAAVLAAAPIPADWVVPGSRRNNAAAILLADGRTVLQTQPFTRCQPGAPATSMTRLPTVDLLGDGTLGAHGGSGLSALGGSLRLGELRPGQTGPRHALKVNLYAREALTRCTTPAACYRWPATQADSYAVGHYGSLRDAPAAMRMGALLAIPAEVSIASLGLETEPARQLAWTLQNYGAYVVDDTWGPGFALNAEAGPAGSFSDQFQTDWGFPLEQRVRDQTPWVRDMQRLIAALQVVDNNAPDRIGGGGTPRQPLAPAFR